MHGGRGVRSPHAGSRSIGAGWALTAQIENLLDEEYELVSGYRTQDRAGYIGVRYEAGGR